MLGAWKLPTAPVSFTSPCAHLPERARLGTSPDLSQQGSGDSPFPRRKGSPWAWHPRHLHRIVLICSLRLCAACVSEGLFPAHDLTSTSGFSSSSLGCLCGSLLRQRQWPTGSCHSHSCKTTSAHPLCPRIKPGPRGDSLFHSSAKLIMFLNNPTSEYFVIAGVP